MDVIEAIRSRNSTRSYKSTPVPKAVLQEILDVAGRSPSTMNTQPWEVTVVAGQVLENIKRSSVDMLNSGVTPQAEVLFQPFEGKYKQRQVDLAVDIFKLMGIGREDKDGRAKWMQRGFRFFDAPVGIILSKDKSLDNSQLSLLDMGAIMQSICLAALNCGLATCIEDQAVMFPEVVRKFTGIPESKRIVIAIAIGYADWDFPANKLKSNRESPESFTTWCGFD